MNEEIMHGPFGLYSRGKPTITHRTEYVPAERLINGTRNAIWDAWQIGLQKGGNTVYPKLPLLDKEPMEPEM